MSDSSSEIMFLTKFEKMALHIWVLFPCANGVCNLNTLLIIVPIFGDISKW